MSGRELHAERILELEFEYARETAGQAQNDRTAVVNLYLLLVGGVGTLLLSQLANSPSTPSEPLHVLLAVLFFLLGLTGFFTLFKLIRLRQAWAESVREMNRIKDYYLAEFPELTEAFLWRTPTIPSPGKLWSITFNLALLVMLIDSTAVAAAVYLLGGRGAWVWLDVVAGTAFLVLQIGFYVLQLAQAEPSIPAPAASPAPLGSKMRAPGAKAESPGR